MLKYVRGRCFLAFMLLLFSAVVFIPNLGHAGFINVLSQEYSVWGYGYGYWGDDDGSVYHETLVDYNIISDKPISVSIQEHFYVPEIGDVGYVDITTSAKGEVTSEYAWVSAFTVFWDEQNAIADGYASSSITFQPLVNMMVISMDLNSWFSGLAEIFDVTENRLLRTWESESYPETPLTMSFNIGHIYSMSVYGYGDLYITPQMNGISVPESSTVFLLFTGLIGLSGIAAGNYSMKKKV
jgi:hypothetical protein